MTYIEQRILSASSQNAQLLKTLAETDYAASALQQNTFYLRDLAQEIAVRTKQVAELSKAKNKELSDHEKYQHSTMRRLAYKLGGKKEEFLAKANKEEREYLEAVQALSQAESGLATLRNNFFEAENTQQKLKSVVAIHNTAQSELDELYDSIFAGPTPEFPEEDAKERPADLAKQAYDQAQLRVNNEVQAHTLLQDASKYMEQCLANLINACDSSNMDMLGWGGRYVDMAERSSLAQAQGNAFQAQMLISQASRLQPLIHSIGPMNIAQGNVMSDVIFDNIFADIAFDRKIWESRRQVEAALRNLGTEIWEQVRRVRDVKIEAHEARERLDVARSELLDVRRGAIERVVKGLPALPAYDA